MSQPLGAYLKILRGVSGLGLREAARQAGISSSYLTQIEGGRIVTPSVKILSSLAKLYGTDYDTLLRVTGIISGESPQGILPAELLGGLSEDEQREVLDYVAFIRWRRARS